MNGCLIKQPQGLWWLRLSACCTMANWELKFPLKTCFSRMSAMYTMTHNLHLQTVEQVSATSKAYTILNEWEFSSPHLYLWQIRSMISKLKVDASVEEKAPELHVMNTHPLLTKAHKPCIQLCVHLFLSQKKITLRGTTTTQNHCTVLYQRG